MIRLKANAAVSFLTNTSYRNRLHIQISILQGKYRVMKAKQKVGRLLVAGKKIAKVK